MPIKFNLGWVSCLYPDGWVQMDSIGKARKCTRKNRTSAIDHTFLQLPGNYAVVVIETKRGCVTLRMKRRRQFLRSRKAYREKRPAHMPPASSVQKIPNTRVRDTNGRVFSGKVEARQLSSFGVRSDGICVRKSRIVMPVHGAGSPVSVSPRTRVALPLLVQIPNHWKSPTRAERLIFLKGALGDVCPPGCYRYPSGRRWG